MRADQTRIAYTVMSSYAGPRSARLVLSAKCGRGASCEGRSGGDALVHGQRFSIIANVFSRGYRSANLQSRRDERAFLPSLAGLVLGVGT
jgi:hypothetical protein